MKVSYNWLKEYVDIKLAPEKLADMLTMAGQEVIFLDRLDDDVVFEIEVTPNRPDCLSMLGVAREIAVILNKPFKEPAVKPLNKTSKKTNITIDDKKTCLLYVGAVVEGVTIKKSPTEITHLLASLGMRGINNVVDITNFSLWENGQPLHAFDYDKLEGGKIIVRKAEKGEKIVTIDGVQRELDPTVLVIADAQKPVAIAGIMGGKDAQVTRHTKNILLESAYFDPISIRRTSRKLGLSSDSSYRFERKVDYAGVVKKSTRAVNLIQKYAGGKITQYHIAEVSKIKTKSLPIAISINRVNDCLGETLTLKQCQIILKNLGCRVNGAGDNLKVFAPSFREDIKIEMDIIEEIARVIGYDNLPMSLPPVAFNTFSVSKDRKFKSRVREICMAQGLNEAVTFSTVSEEMLAKTGIIAADSLQITNPLSQDQVVMRSEILPSLLSIAQLNLNRGQKNIRLFELGKIYSKGQKNEECVLGIVLGGAGHSFLKTKGAFEAVFKYLGIEQENFEIEEKNHPYFENGQMYCLVCKGENVAMVGKIKSDILQRWSFKEENIYFAQIFCDKIFPMIHSKRKFVKFSEYPAVTRDVSLAIKEETRYQDIVNLINQNKSELLRKIDFVDQYSGQGLPFGYNKSITISLRYQSDDRTLREEEVAQAHDLLVKILTEQLKVTLR